MIFWDFCQYFGSTEQTLWQTRTIQYRRHLTGRLEWLGGLWNFWSSSLPHQRGRALPLWRLSRAWLGMSKIGYLNKKQGHLRLTMLCLFIYLLIYWSIDLLCMSLSWHEIRYRTFHPAPSSVSDLQLLSDDGGERRGQLVPAAGAAAESPDPEG